MYLMNNGSVVYTGLAKLMLGLMLECRAGVVSNGRGYVAGESLHRRRQYCRLQLVDHVADGGGGLRGSCGHREYGQCRTAANGRYLGSALGRVFGQARPQPARG